MDLKKKTKFRIENLKEMTKENIIKNTGVKYSEMLIQLVQEFDEKLPNELTFQETLEVGIEAWNLANNKDLLDSKNLYEDELKGYENQAIINEMVNYKIDKFSDFNNVIVDYSTIDDILQVKTQTQEDHFNNIVKNMININYQK